MAQNASANQLIEMVEKWYAKLPPLPKSWTEVIVKITPWLALIFGVLGVLTSLAAVGILTVLAPFVAMGSGVGTASGGIIGAVLALVSSGLLLAAFPGTKAKKMSGWNMLFYSEVVSLVASVIAMTISGVVGVLIGLYILFQIKNHYK
ncbi:MAG: hypothetical protein A2776_01915 [Candidatus Levybacteria bacterium RIFCSPHIGHO2_01_FULL_40_10]|nr:MAG: hypothetical protein A2776_01915 [Candidatus Levybacteria bacterium RIFCSPHIGHO2_01_FULL_40_10]